MRQLVRWHTPARGADVGVLGATVAQQCLDAGLLDEVVVHVCPVLLGAGVRLFDSDGTSSIPLHAISATVDGELTALRFSTVG